MLLDEIKLIILAKLFHGRIFNLAYYRKKDWNRLYGSIDDFNKINFHDYVEDFAIFKWSREDYDPEEWFFPGVEHVDGTIEGAMKAGLEAYPV